MRSQRRTVRWSSVLLLCAVLLSPADAVWAETAPAERIVPIVVALEPFAPVQAADPEWLSRFVQALESKDSESPLALQVNEAVTLEHSLLGDPQGLDSQLELQQRALLTAASYLVVGKVTRLAQHYSLDVRVLGAAELKVFAHLVYEGEGPGGFSAAIDEAADAVRDVLGRQVAPAVEGERRASARAEFGPDVEEITSAGVNTVVEVRVRGNRRIEADAIRAVVGTRVGEPLRRDRIGEDVRRIYKLGFFRNVQVEATDELEGKLVTFVVEENPIIRRVSVSGNESVGSSDIKDQLTLTVGSTIDYPLLLENQARVEALYKAQGFHLVKVSYSVEPLGQDNVAINYDIIEGGKLRLVQIDFEGNESLPDDELLKVAQTKPWGWKSYVSHFWDRSGVYAEPVFYQDLDRITRRYMDEGFIRANISDPEVVHDKDGLRVKVRITEGPRYLVGDVEVIGDESMDRDELWGLLELVEGDVFSRSTLTDDVERLRAHYADRGFFSARVTPRTRVDDEARAVGCAFDVEKGSLYFVDRIEVRGNTRTRDGVIRRELGLGEGELYSANALRRSQARVRRLGFFEEVDLETKPLEEANRVAVDVDVVERPTGSFSFGAGVGSTDGFLLNASLRQDNLFGKGYGLHANVDFGSENANMYLRFTNPYFLGSSAGLSATLSRTDREYVDFDQESLGFSFNVSYPLDEGETRLGSGYAYNQREITGIGEFQAASLLQREEFQGESDTSMTTLSMVRDTRDDIRFPRSGQVSGFAVEFAGLGGLNQFLRIEGRTTWFLPAKRWLGFDSTFVVNSRFGWAIPFNDISDFDLPECTGDIADNTSCRFGVGVLGNGQLQALTTIDDDIELGLTERYFLGGLGAFQVRGYKQRSLGPRRTLLVPEFVGGDTVFHPSNRVFVQGFADRCLDGSNNCNDIGDKDIDDFEDLDLTDVIGGNKMFLLNLELQFPISEELGLRGIVFFDMGNAFAEDEAINPADFRFGAGGGLQWFSPFGPILVQLGFPLDKLEDEEGSVFEFSFGGSQF